MINLLTPELDKLRNKELSSGCRVKMDVEVYTVVDADDLIDNGSACLIAYANNMRIDIFNREETIFLGYKGSGCQILGHPLTRGRIEYLMYNNTRNEDDGQPLLTYDKIATIFTKNTMLLDQNELQWQTNEKRPELKQLLIEFSKHF